MSDGASGSSKVANFGGGVLKKAFAQVENSVETAQAQNEFINDTSVDKGIVKKTGTSVMNKVNVAAAAVQGVANGAVTAATLGIVKAPVPTVRTVADALHKKDDRVFDKNAVKQINKDNLNGADTTVEQRKKAYGASARGQKAVDEAVDKLDELYPEPAAGMSDRDVPFDVDDTVLVPDDDGLEQ